MTVLTHSAVLLVGGRSTRMARDKARLAYDDVPLWRHQWETLGRTDPAHRFLSVAADSDFPVDPECVVTDRVPDAGPLGGLEAAMARCPDPLLLALAIDLPLMEADYLSELLGQCEPGVGCVPVLDGRYEPLAAVYPGGLLPLVQAFLADERFALQELIAEGVEQGALKPVPIAAAQGRFFTNVNTPDEWSLLARPSSDGSD